jgi:hypothetical protein
MAEECAADQIRKSVELECPITVCFRVSQLKLSRFWCSQRQG